MTFGSAPQIPAMHAMFGPEWCCCWHETPDGSVCVEVVVPGTATIPAYGDSYVVTSFEYFAHAMLEADGLWMCDGRLVFPDILPDIETLGYLTHVLDEVDLVHPRARHAFEDHIRVVGLKASGTVSLP